MFLACRHASDESASNLGSLASTCIRANVPTDHSRFQLQDWTGFMFRNFAEGPNMPCMSNTDGQHRLICNESCKMYAHCMSALTRFWHCHGNWWQSASICLTVQMCRACQMCVRLCLAHSCMTLYTPDVQQDMKWRPRRESWGLLCIPCH